MVVATVCTGGSSTGASIGSNRQQRGLTAHPRAGVDDEVFGRGPHRVECLLFRQADRFAAVHGNLEQTPDLLSVDAADDHPLPIRRPVGGAGDIDGLANRPRLGPVDTLERQGPFPALSQPDRDLKPVGRDRRRFEEGAARPAPDLCRLLVLQPPQAVARPLARQVEQGLAPDARGERANTWHAVRSHVVNCSEPRHDRHVKSSARGFGDGRDEPSPIGGRRDRGVCSRPGSPGAMFAFPCRAPTATGRRPPDRAPWYSTVRGSSGASDVTISRSVNVRRWRSPVGRIARCSCGRCSGAVDEVDPLSIGRPYWRMIVEPLFALVDLESDSHHRGPRP